jgi:hypothetical protein
MLEYALQQQELAKRAAVLEKRQQLQSEVSENWLVTTWYDVTYCS